MLKIFFRTAILRSYEPHVIFRDRFPTRLASRQRSGVPDASSKELGHGKGASDQQDSSPFELWLAPKKGSKLCLGSLGSKCKGVRMTRSVLALAAVFVTLSTAAFAGPVTDEEKQFCAYDYRQYCGQDGLGSNLLRDCMEQHGKSLSPQCIQALVDAGEVTKGEVEQREKSGQ